MTAVAARACFSLSLQVEQPEHLSLWYIHSHMPLDNWVNFPLTLGNTALIPPNSASMSQATCPDFLKIWDRKIDCKQLSLSWNVILSHTADKTLFEEIAPQESKLSRPAIKQKAAVSTYT